MHIKSKFGLNSFDGSIVKLVKSKVTSCKSEEEQIKMNALVSAVGHICSAYYAALLKGARLPAREQGPTAMQLASLLQTRLPRGFST